MILRFNGVRMVSDWKPLGLSKASVLVDSSKNMPVLPISDTSLSAFYFSSGGSNSFIGVQ